MNAFGNKRNSMLAVFSVLMLLGAAFLGLAMIPGITAAPGDVDEPIWDAVNLTASIDADVTFVFSTTMDQNITLTWDWADPLPVDGHLSDVLVGITDNDAFEEQIYGWNLTTDGGSPLKTAIWNQNGTLPAGEYDFVVVVKFWNETDQIYTFDMDAVGLMIASGSDFITSVSADPDTVVNDGMAETVLTFRLNRLFTEIDVDNAKVSLYLEGSPGEVELEVDEPEPANITLDMVNHTTVAMTTVMVPLDQEVGNYHIYAFFEDLWGYNDTFEAHILTVEWYDRPLMEAEDTTILVDETEMMATFDPLDLFYDPDGPVNLTVSLGYEAVYNNVTNITEMVPIWTYEDENITIELNETNFANSVAKVNVDVEEGSWDFPTTAWIDGEPVLNGTATVEIVPVNDIPMLTMDTLTVYKNTPADFNLSMYFEDADGPMLNLTVNTSVSGALLTYNWETFMLNVNPATNWTGSIDVEINATDGIAFALYTLTIEVILMSYDITGTLTFDEVSGVEVNMSNITLKIGGDVVVFNMTTGAFSVTLEEGNYTVELTIPEMYLYSEDDEMSGYLMPELENILLTEDTTYDIDVEYLVFEPQVEEATWDDIDWESKTISDDDGTIEITVGVKDVNKTGYGDLNIQFVIKGKDDEKFTFNMTWNPTDKLYTLELSEDDLKDVPEGKREYYFTDGTDVSPNYEYEFKEKDENANLITVIVLIVLIILVLIALVFIMRKPSEEEFDEEEEEEEEEGERSCPSCGETVTDEEAQECPYCGENLGEE